MATSINEEKAFYELQHTFMLETLRKLGIEGLYFNPIKNIYKKPTVNIMLNGERMNVFLLNSKEGQNVLFHLSFST